MDNKILLEARFDNLVLEEAEGGKTLRLSGVVMFENALSKNGEFFPASFIDDSIAKTMVWWEEGGVSTMHRSHDAWWQGAMPIGKITALSHSDQKMKFESEISRTSDGADMITLLRDGVIKSVSLRSMDYDGHWVGAEDSEFDRPLYVLDWAVFDGIDFCERPGITGAGIDRIFESAPKWAKEKLNMEWKEIKLEDLSLNRPDLLAAHLRETLGGFVEERDNLKAAATEAEAKITALEAEKVELTSRLEEKETDTTAVDELNEKITAIEADRAAKEQRVNVFEQASPKWLVALVDELSDCAPETLAESIKEKRDEIINKFLSVKEPAGDGNSPDNEKHEDAPKGDGVVTLDVIKNTRK